LNIIQMRKNWAFYSSCQENQNLGLVLRCFVSFLPSSLGFIFFTFLPLLIRMGALSFSSILLLVLLSVCASEGANPKPKPPSHNIHNPPVLPSHVPPSPSRSHMPQKLHELCTKTVAGCRKNETVKTCLTSHGCNLGEPTSGHLKPSEASLAACKKAHDACGWVISMCIHTHGPPGCTESGLTPTPPPPPVNRECDFLIKQCKASGLYTGCLVDAGCAGSGQSRDDCVDVCSDVLLECMQFFGNHNCEV
jgi:hypothetical protein